MAAMTVVTGCVTQQEPQWPLRHGTSTNTDYVDIDGPRSLRPAWFLGPGAPIGTFVAIGESGTVYSHSYNGAETPEGPNAGCRLWALEAHTGNVRWCRRDVAPSLTSLALTANEDVIVTDGQFLWSFSKGGALNWKTGVETESSSVTLMPGGEILVADYDGTLRMYDPANGREISEAFRLEAARNPVGPFSGFEATGQLFTGVAPEYKDQMIQNFFGYDRVIKDMPMVHPVTERIFIAANGETPEEGRLWALNFERSGDDSAAGRFDVHCSTAMGPASDTSPALSADGQRVYAAAAGRLYAFSTEDCTLAWEILRPGYAASSPAVAPDGGVYLMSGRSIDAYRDFGSAAEPLWSVPARQLADTFGVKDGVFDSVAIISRDYLYVSMSLGVQATGYFVPVAHRLIVIDRATGEMVSSTSLGEESDSTPSLANDGWIYVPTKALARGHAISMRIAGLEDETLKAIPIRRPETGIYAFRPVE
jgi:outer membrane protein assembly factor BamB